MKLLLITCIANFEKDVKTVLQKSNVSTYTFKEVTGFHDISEEAMENNWFAAERNETDSLLFFVFVRKENVEHIFQMADAFNAKQQSLSHIHIAVLDIEQSNHPKLHKD